MNLVEEQAYNFRIDGIVLDSESNVDSMRNLLFTYHLKNEFLGLEKEINKITPLMSVCIPTYQHEKYIKKCIDGVLLQKTNFSFEIIICDDGSYDKTPDIIKNYALNHQDKIRFFDHKRSMTRIFDKNGKVKLGFNWIWTLESARGKYIALCEGDDYWTDPLKLQRQVDFLEKNLEYSLSCHRYRIFDEDTKKFMPDYCAEIFEKNGNSSFEFDLEFALNNWITKTLTLVFRRDLFDVSLSLKYKYYRDVHFVCDLLSKGKGYCFSFDGGVYRMHLGGVHSKIGKINQLETSYRLFKELYQTSPTSLFKKHYMNFYLSYFKECIYSKNIKRALSSFGFNEMRFLFMYLFLKFKR